MSERLKRAAAFVLAVSAGVTLFVLDDGQNQPVEGCRGVDMACTFFLDGGYSERQFRATKCDEADGGVSVVLPSFRRGLAEGFLSMETCRTLGACEMCDAGVEDAPSVGGCACWQQDAGACERRNSRTGLWAPAPHRTELAPGHWRGPGCAHKPCGELFGFPSLPSPCN